MNVKVYNYDPFDKFFTYESKADLDPITQKPMLPAHSTFIEIPRNYSAEVIPVFNEEEQKWEVKKNSFWYPKIEEINFYTGRDAEGIPQIPFSNYYDIVKKSNFRSIPRLLNAALFCMHLSERFRLMNNYIHDVFITHTKIMKQSQGLCFDIINISQYNATIEFIVYLMKKSIDEIIMMTYVQSYYEKIVTTHYIAIQSIGDLFSNNPKYETERQTIKERVGFVKCESFFRIINDVHNGYKHDLFLAEMNMLFGENFPTVRVLKARNDKKAGCADLNRISYHNHSLGQMVIGFSNFITDFFDRKE